MVHGAGTAHLVGTLSLDNTKVRCIADLSLETFTVGGYLERMQP